MGIGTQHSESLCRARVRALITLRSLVSVCMCGVLAAGCAAPGASAETTSASAAASEPGSPTAASPDAATPPTTGAYSLGHFPEPPTSAFASTTVAALQAVLDAAVENGLHGVTATLMAADRGVWSGAAGVTGAASEPMELGSRFDVASIEKTIIAAEAMRLSEAGLLDLDDPISEHMPPELEFDTNGATVRDLLAMESGIPEPTMVAGPDLPADTQTWTTAQILSTVPSYRLEPGINHTYSNNDYALLILVLDEVTRATRGAEPRVDILGDSRLTGITSPPDEQLAGPLALPPFESDATNEATKSGLWTDSATLGVAGWLLFGGDLLSDESLAAMTDFGAGAEYDRYGLGVFELTNIGTGFDAYAVGNGGWGDYHSSSLVVLPAEGVVITVLANVGGDPREITVPIAQQLAAALEP